MQFVLQIITYWAVLAGCVIIPFLTWSYLRAERTARRRAAECAVEWLASTDLKPPA
jgi:hypothetical protein